MPARATEPSLESENRRSPKIVTAANSTTIPEAFAEFADLPCPPSNDNHGGLTAVYAGKIAGPSAWLWQLWERRRFLSRAVVWGLALSTVAAFMIPKRYDSTTRLMPPDGQSGSGLAMLSAMAGKGGLGMGSMAGDLLGMHGSGALFVDILRSRTVEDRIVNRFDLRKVYGERHGVDACKRLGSYTDIDEDRKSEVITIRVTDRDPRRASQIAAAYVDELDRLVAEVSTSAARRQRIFIEGRLAGVKQELDQASREFSQFASQNAALDITAQAKAMVEAADRLQGELIASRSQLQGLEQIYTSNNVRVRSLQARVDELSRQLDKLDGSATGGSPAISSGSNQAEVAASSSFPSIRQLPLLGVRWAELYRQTKMEEAVYELLTQQYELAKIEEAKEIPTVKVLDAADVPEKRSSPHRAAIIISGTLLAFSAGALWILSAATWEQIAPQDSRKRLGLEVAHRMKTFCSQCRERGRAFFLRRTMA
jgi:capsule polysaccharide export protein KpsE/RkpR